MLAHGVALDLHVWDDLAKDLAARYRVVRYDSRGHGRSSPGSTPFTLSDLADDAIGPLDALDISKVHFVGLSMGGMVGVAMAIAHPDRLMSASLCNARGKATPEYCMSWDGRIAAVRQGGLAAIADATIARWFTPQVRVSSPEIIQHIKAMVLATSPEGYCLSAKALKGLNFADRLPESRVPILYLAGSDDQGAPPEDVLRLHVTTPGSRYVELAGTGHISVRESRAAFSEAIHAFIRANEH
jgi:3-oxoadipate enol-lactonase